MRTWDIRFFNLIEKNRNSYLYYNLNTSVIPGVHLTRSFTIVYYKKTKNMESLYLNLNMTYSNMQKFADGLVISSAAVSQRQSVHGGSSQNWIFVLG